MKGASPLGSPLRAREQGPGQSWDSTPSSNADACTTAQPSPNTPPGPGFHLHQMQDSHQAILTQAWEAQENHGAEMYVVGALNFS